MLQGNPRFQEETEQIIFEVEYKIMPIKVSVLVTNKQIEKHMIHIHLIHKNT